MSNWKIAISPSQRFVIFQLSHEEKAKITDNEHGKRYRRFMKAFGLKQIGEAIRERKTMNSKLMNSNTPALHEISIENVEAALKMLNRERSPIFEDVVGDLIDTLEEPKPGKVHEAPAGIPEFDPSTENWIEQEADDEAE
jgi:hypothetical protein